jgi:hypothetical protein
MINWIYEVILRIYKFADENRTAFDLSLGGLMGLVSGLVDYWKHWTQPEIQFHFWDGVVGTVSQTVVGAIILLLIHRFFPKAKKK